MIRLFYRRIQQAVKIKQAGINGVPNENDRLLGAIFLEKLLMGSLSDLKVSKSGVSIGYAQVNEALKLTFTRQLS